MRPYNSRRTDRTGLNFILAFIMGILASVFSVWAIVEFILYLVKDNPFNWWSVVLTAVALIGEIYYFIRTIMSD